MKKIVLTLCCLAAADVFAAGPSIFPEEQLETARTAYAAGDARAVQAVELLRAAADDCYMDLTAPSVADKRTLPPSNDPRDYMTLSPYWWPDPSKADGLPYIRRDGERNPEVYDCPERESAGTLGDAAQCLALLYHVTGEERYAGKCAELLRTWFLDPERGMNPNMAFAQLIPGRRKLRGTGIIDARRFCYALSAATLLEGSPNWTAEDASALRAWAGAFCYWLERSTQGRLECAARNNHGLWYEAIHLMTLAAAGADRAQLRSVAEKELLPRLGAQIAADGSLPEELARTLSLHYSTFALEALAVADALTAGDGWSLWNYTSPEGRSLRQAVEFLRPYWLDPAAWPHRQIKPFDPSRGALILHAAGRATGNELWLCDAERIGYRTKVADRHALLCFEIFR